MVRLDILLIPNLVFHHYACYCLWDFGKFSFISASLNLFFSWKFVEYYQMPFLCLLRLSGSFCSFPLYSSDYVISTDLPSCLLIVSSVSSTLLLNHFSEFWFAIVLFNSRVSICPFYTLRIYWSLLDAALSSDLSFYFLSSLFPFALWYG